MEARDTDNRLALEALDIAHTKYEQELESSLLFHQANIDRLHIEKMERQRRVYSIIVILLLCGASFMVFANKNNSLKSSDWRCDQSVQQNWDHKTN